LLIVFGCSSSEETTSEEKQKAEDEIYIFDEVPIDDTQPSDDSAPKEIDRKFVIQIGAFSSIQNANKFAQESTIILSEDVKVDYDNRTSLYVVTLSRIFNSRMSATIRRNELWRYKEFSDAWLKQVK
jgi:hypothetical protein